MIPGSPLGGSFILSWLFQEEVCRVDSSGQVNSGQMGPDTCQETLAKPGLHSLATYLL